MKKLITSFFALLAVTCLVTTSCGEDNSSELHLRPVGKLSDEMIKIRDYVPKNAVVAHRGTAKYAPESTEAAYRWARNNGADYLEADLQMTKDGKIVIVHDNDIMAKTNLAQLQSEGKLVGKKPVVSDFTYEELMQLDAGSWFVNKETNPGGYQYGKESFKGLKIITLKDMIKIAEGFIPIRNEKGMTTGYKVDPKDNGNRPGVYLETKQPELNPGLEEVLAKELAEYGWDITKKPALEKEWYKGGKVNIGNTNAKVVFQTFSKNSLLKLESIWHGQIPTCLLMWLEKGKPTDSDMGSLSEYMDRVQFALDHKAQFIGPSVRELIKEGNRQEGDSEGYWDLLTGFDAQIHSAGLYIHPYTFDRIETMEKYFTMCEGMFTNIADETAKFYREKGLRNDVDASFANSTLESLGYN